MSLTDQVVLLATEAGGSAASDTPLEASGWVWAVFVAFIAILLLVDLKIVMRDPHRIEVREAAIYSAVWIALGVGFTLLVWWWWGGDNASEYITGYLIEKSLSIDNVFVWSVLFTFFAVKPEYQHRVLFWGIFGALVLRAIFIFAGVALLESFDWIVYVFGAFLLYTAYKIGTSGGDIEVHPDRNPVLQRVRKVIPQTPDFHGEHFWWREDGKLKATPMLTVLIAIELTDVLFAVDSVPAILAITTDEFLVFSSNAFAILGLRALYFLLAGVKDRFVYLDIGLGIILGFVGVKFILTGFGYHIPTSISLGFIAVVLTLTMWLSWRRSGRDQASAGEDEGRRSAGDERGPGGDGRAEGVDTAVGDDANERAGRDAR